MGGRELPERGLLRRREARLGRQLLHLLPARRGATEPIKGLEDLGPLGRLQRHPARRVRDSSSSRGGTEGVRMLRLPWGRLGRSRGAKGVKAAAAGGGRGGSAEEICVERQRTVYGLGSSSRGAKRICSRGGAAERVPATGHGSRGRRGSWLGCRCGAKRICPKPIKSARGRGRGGGSCHRTTPEAEGVIKATSGGGGRRSSSAHRGAKGVQAAAGTGWRGLQPRHSGSSSGGPGPGLLLLLTRLHRSAKGVVVEPGLLLLLLPAAGQRPWSGSVPRRSERIQVGVVGRCRSLLLLLLGKPARNLLLLLLGIPARHLLLLLGLGLRRVLLGVSTSTLPTVVSR